MPKLTLTYTIRLSEKEKRLLKRASRLSGVPMAEIIRMGMMAKAKYLIEKFAPPKQVVKK